MARRSFCAAGRACWRTARLACQRPAPLARRFSRRCCRWSLRSPCGAAAPQLLLERRLRSSLRHRHAEPVELLERALPRAVLPGSQSRLRRSVPRLRARSTAVLLERAAHARSTCSCWNGRSGGSPATWSCPASARCCGTCPVLEGALGLYSAYGPVLLSVFAFYREPVRTLALAPRYQYLPLA